MDQSPSHSLRSLREDLLPGRYEAKKVLRAWEVAREYGADAQTTCEADRSGDRIGRVELLVLQAMPFSDYMDQYMEE